MIITPETSFLEVISGPMFAGKSSELFNRFNVLKKFAPDVRLYRFNFDDRYGETNKTHNKVEFDAKDTTIVDSLDSLIDNIKTNDPKSILVEEGQFYKDMNMFADYLEYLVHEKNKIVVVTALPTDYRGKEFNNIGKLMALADYNTQLRAQCSYVKGGDTCGMPATKTQRLSDNKELVVVGGADMYEARCRKHFTK